MLSKLEGSDLLLGYIDHLEARIIGREDCQTWKPPLHALQEPESQPCLGEQS
jgi:hypothetical protein